MCCSKTVSCLVRNLARQCDASRAAQGECISQVAQKRLEYAANGRYLPSCWVGFCLGYVPFSESLFTLPWGHTHEDYGMLSALGLCCAGQGKEWSPREGSGEVWGHKPAWIVYLSLSFICLFFVCLSSPPPPFKAKHLSLPKTNTPYLLNSQCISSLALSILVSGALAQVISITIHSLPA